MLLGNGQSEIKPVSMLTRQHNPSPATYVNHFVFFVFYYLKLYTKVTFYITVMSAANERYMPKPY